MYGHQMALCHLRLVPLIVVLAMCFTFIAGPLSAAAQSTPPQIVSPEVIRTGAGPTGYSVTFRYWDGNPATHNIKIRGEWYFSDAAHTTTTSSAGWLPAQWIPGAFPIAYPNNSYEPNWPIQPMTQDPQTLIWSFTTPMASGTYTYGFLLNCTNADFGSSDGCPTDAQIADPNNPPWNTSGSVEPTSQVYVPPDRKFGTPDLSWQSPNRVHGTLLDVTYPSPQSTDPAGQHYLVVYLPPVYDAHRQPAYPTLYLSHGGGGNEVDWTTQGVAGRIIDNLIADKKAQPMVVVMTNLNNLGACDLFDGSCYTKEVTENVIPFVEANYNVARNANDRAFAGLSLGGLRANDLLFNATTSFGYFASWSIGTMGTPPVGDPRWQNPALKTRLGIQIGGGVFDWLTIPGIDEYEAILTANGIPFVDYRMDGGHEWYVWRQTLIDYASTMAFRHTTTSVSQDAAPGSSEGRSVVFVTARVKPDTTEPAGPAGKVQFYLDSQKVEPAMPVLPDGTAKLALPRLSPGPHAVTAVYGGDNFYTTSTSAALVVIR
jgi:enterochelin esterase-like enzyme